MHLATVAFLEHVQRFILQYTTTVEIFTQLFHWRN